MTALAVTSRVDWYATRSAGAVALVLLTMIVLLGLLGPLRIGNSRWPRFTIGALHRDLSLLALLVLAVHIVTAVIDSFAPIGVLDALIPLHSAYRPLWVGLGATAFDLLLALTVTSLVRRRLGYERWRGIHWLAYACWPIAVLHGLGTGSDAREGWMQVLTGACIVVTVGALIVRIARAQSATPSLRTGTLTAAVATPLAIGGFALLGPFQPGWAATAGTPAKLLASHTTTRPAASTVHRTFSAPLAGRLHRRRAAGGRLLDLDLVLQGASPGQLRIRLAGHPAPGGGISLVGSQVDLSAPGLGGVYAGTVTHLAGDRFTATVRQAGGAGWRMSALVAIDPSGRVSGRLSGTALR